MTENSVAPESSVGQVSFVTSKVEHRRAPRITGHYPAITRGVDADGQRFTEYSTLENISACGVGLVLGRRLELGARIFVIARLLVTPLDKAPRPRVALRGRVVRFENRNDGTYRVGIELTNHRFLYGS